MYFKPSTLKIIHILLFVFVIFVHSYEIAYNINWLTFTDRSTLAL